MIFLRPAFALALLMLALFATPAIAAPVKVVTSFSILADMVRQIGGADVDVISLVGPDADAHGFEPRPTHVKSLSGAALLVLNGLGFEPWAPRLIASANYKGPVLTASTGIHPRMMNDHGHGIVDPHAWQSLANGEAYALNIENALAGLNPAQAEKIHERGAAYREELRRLDQWVRAEFAAIPQANRKVITSHDSFGYFGDAYGVVFLSPEGLNTDSEPSARALATLVSQIKREKIKALFIENMSAPQMMSVIARETGATLGPKLYSDAASPSDAAAPTYEAMFRHNVAALKAALADE